MVDTFLRRISALATSLRIRAMVRRAEPFRSKRMWAEAAQIYRQTLDLYPGIFGVWVQYGHMLKELGRLDDAQEAYMQAMTLGPGDADLHVQLGHLHNLRGDAERMEEYYRRAGELGSADPHASRFRLSSPVPLAEQSSQLRAAPALFSHADGLRDAGQWKEAAEFYRQGLKKAPLSLPHWIQLGNMLKEADDLQAAEKAYAQGANISADDSDLQLQIGHLLTRMARRNEASVAYLRAIELGSRDRLALARVSDAARSEILSNSIARFVERRQTTIDHRNVPARSFAGLIVDATAGSLAPSGSDVRR